MRATGACEIPAFVRADALPGVHRGRAAARAARAPQRRARHRVPRLSRRVVPASITRSSGSASTTVGAVAYDLFPADSPIRRLYEWDELTRFVAAILGLDEIYPYADPLGALNLAVMGDGDQLQWHFDQTDFVVSLAVQDADDGRRLRGRAADPHRRRRALRRRRARARRRDASRRHAADDAGHAARVRGPLLAAPRQPDRRARRRGSSACSATTPNPGTMSSELLKEVRYGRAVVTSTDAGR